MAIKARLKDGQIIELVKDCTCLHHEGPHWLHMDQLREEINRGRLGEIKIQIDRAVTAEKTDPVMVGWLSLAIQGYAQAEFERLGEKRQNYHKLSVVEIVT